MKLYTKNDIGLKTLVLSDLHVASVLDAKMLKKVMDIVSKNDYDAIFVVGDILDYINFLKEDIKIRNILFSFMRFLGSQAKTFVVYGNHDLCYWNTGSKRTNSWILEEKIAMEEFFDVIAGYSGIEILNNSTSEVTSGYTVSGINPSCEYATGVTDGDGAKLLEEAKNYNFLKNLNPENTNILLCHYPNAILQLKEETDLLDKVQVSICGHNHNGAAQLRIFPLEKILDFLGMKNRGLITPGKSFKLADTKILRGVVDFDDGSKMIINPAVKMFSRTAGCFEHFNWMFYMGYTEIDFTNMEDKKIK